MNHTDKSKLVITVVFALLLVLQACNLPGQNIPAGQQFTARIVSVLGAGFAQNPDQEDWIPLAENLDVQSGGQVFAGPDSLVRLDLPDGSQVHIGAYTLINVDIISPDQARIILIEGEIWVIPGSSDIQFDTPYGIGFEQGAYMGASFDRVDDRVVFTCLQGTCQVGNDGGNLALASGQSAWFSADTQVLPLLKDMTMVEYDDWGRVYPQALAKLYAPTPTADTYSLLAGTATQIALTQSAQMTATATVFGDNTPNPTSALNTPQPTVSTTTTFTNAIGAPSGTISNCVHSYYVDAVDPHGINYVKVEHSLSPNFSNSISIKLTNVWGDTWAEPRVFDTTANPGTDTVYWRFWALDNTGDITYFPAGTPFSYKDPLNCGGPVVFSNVVGPTSGEISQCENYYSVVAKDNTERIISVMVEYALNPKLKNSQWLSLSNSGSTWSGTHLIDTSSSPGDDTVYWRFWARSFNHGDNIFYHPDNGTFSYLDRLNYGGPSPTPSPTLAPTQTATIPPSSATPTPTPASSSTPTLTPTSTTSPTLSPSPTPSPSPTDPPTETPTSTPTETQTLIP